MATIIIASTIEKRALVVKGKYEDSSSLVAAIENLNDEDKWFSSIDKMKEVANANVLKSLKEGNDEMIAEGYKCIYSGKDFNTYVELQKEDIENWKEEWGQSIDEVISELGLEVDGAEEAILNTGYYFFLGERVYTKDNSFFSTLDDFVSKRLQ